jgi:hypothetical protein
MDDPAIFSIAQSALTSLELLSDPPVQTQENRASGIRSANAFNDFQVSPKRMLCTICVENAGIPLSVE